VGDKISLSGNTGFSTGPHVHFMMYEMQNGEVINVDNGYKGAVDPKPFFTGEYAQDQKIVTLQKQVVVLLTNLINLLKK
jgi:murein DD-endopeptidase MepM/ murein hydrolase activator NlpD